MSELFTRERIACSTSFQISFDILGFGIIPSGNAIILLGFKYVYFPGK